MSSGGQYHITFTDADNTVRREGGLVVVDVDDIDAQGAGARQLGRSFVRGDDCQTVKVPNLPVENDVGLDDAGKGRFDHEGVVVIAIHDVVDSVGVRARVAVRRRNLKMAMNPGH